MVLKDSTKNKIKDEIIKVVDRVIKRRTIDEPFDVKELEEERPFHVALLPEEILKGSKFERSFVTSLGQSVWEEIARIIIEEEWGYSKRGQHIEGEIYQSQLKTIQKILNELEHARGGRKPNWKEELKEIDEAASGEKIKISVVVDIYGESKNKKLYCELKSSKPNSDQTKVSKEKLMKIYAMKKGENYDGFYALPDNPFKTKENYTWPHPKRWFEMDKEPVVMGRDFWDSIGGKGTYEELIKIFQEAGKITKPKIKKEFLGI
ncbi:TdeIII family type II restriction endonuclease [Candidatus Woesearchaeota archaeon]|nr:TdeIII family type II restriction endonuclease [Candidatus Woesearchaeota archaeon]